MASAHAHQQLPLVDVPDSDLDRSLAALDRFLALLGFRHHTLFAAIASWLAFFLLSLAFPLFTFNFSRCYGCDKFEIDAFENEILASRAIVAAVSLLCLSRNLRKYGIRNALFVDRCHDHTTHFRKQYIHKIRGFYCLVGSWFWVCFLLKAAREVTRLMYLNHGSWWFPSILFFACLLSWSYSTLIFLAGCAFFNLAANLLLIHFENYGKVLEKDLEISAYIEEHMSLTYDLSKISHRFRVFLLLQFLFVTSSQILALLQTTENQGMINVVNAGDFAVLSIVELVGMILCLTAASKLSHRAQSLGSIASRWHALVTCNSNDVPGSGIVDNVGNTQFCSPANSLPEIYADTDLESTDYSALPASFQLVSSTSSYNKRQAFVTYVQSNTGGFTIFGWTVDRMLINTIFFVELSLVFFVLGKTITIPSR